MDTVGVLMLIGVVLFGWMPGPGGIPLLIAGLSLLAANHEWARRLLEYVKVHGASVLTRLFTNHPIVKIGFDVISVLLVIAAIYVIALQTRNIVQSIAIAGLYFGIGIFLLNRRRIQRLYHWVRRR